MKISKVSCEQFAGLMDAAVSFGNGINVVYGKNESGKSTLVNLISNTLFKSSKLDNRSDKQWGDLYFPAANKDKKMRFSVIDGKVIFESNGDSYTVIKSWGDDSFSKLRTEDGQIVGDEKVNAELRNVLGYSESIYRDILFSNQVGNINALKRFLDSNTQDDTKKDLAEIMAQLVSENDGISADTILEAINAKIDGISGKHWDLQLDRPAKKSRFQTGLGEILTAFYEMEDAQAELKRISELETNCDTATQSFKVAEAELEKASEIFNCVKESQSIIERKNRLDEKIDRLKIEIERLSNDLSDWKVAKNIVSKLKPLLKELNYAIVLEKYSASIGVKKEIDELKEALEALGVVDEDDVKSSESLERSIQTLEQKLKGMNILANIKMLNSADVSVTSIATGEPVELNNGIANIQEAVKIVVSNVLEITLSPADVDVNIIKNDIEDVKGKLVLILEKYQVESVEKLQEKLDGIKETKNSIKDKDYELKRIIGEEQFEVIEAQAKEITSDTRTSEAIKAEIVLLCPINEAENKNYSCKQETNRFEERYSSIENLKKQIEEKQKDLQLTDEELKDLVISEEFCEIENVDAYIKQLENKKDEAIETREGCLKLKIKAEEALSSFVDNIDYDPSDNYLKKKERFENVKATLKHWLHIKDVLLEVKAGINSNPMADVADSFSKYLGIITDEKISTESNDDERLDVSIYTGKKLVDFAKLSEGSKETVALAFRLAVLDHLFPNGDGVIVLDDPLTNMDADRTKKSIDLIKECAKKHQVILLTCKEDYISELEGNLIKL